MAQLTNKYSSRGFSLVELMIAIVLGLFVISGLYTMLSSNQRTYSAVQANTQITDAERRIDSVMQKMLNQAGYRNYRRLKSYQQLPARTSDGAPGQTLTWLEGQAITGVNNSSGKPSVKDGTDTISLRFYGSSLIDANPSTASTTDDGSIFSCHGGWVQADVNMIVTIYVDPDNNLMCKDNINLDPIILESGVESLQVRYKLRDGNTFSPAFAAGNSNWNKIQVIEYALLLTKPYRQGMLNNQTSFTLLDQSVSAAADGQLRQVVTGSSLLRNQISTP